MMMMMTHGACLTQCAFTTVVEYLCFRCPDKIVHDHDVARLFVSAFLHVDDWHLYHNMCA